MSVRRRINIYVALLIGSLVVLVALGGGFVQLRTTDLARMRSRLDDVHLAGQQYAAEAEVTLLRIREIVKATEPDAPSSPKPVDSRPRLELSTARYLLRDQIRRLAGLKGHPMPLLQWQVQRVNTLHASLESQIDMPGTSPDARRNLMDGLFGALEQLRLLHAIEYRKLAHRLDELDRAFPIQLAGLIGVLGVVGIALVVRLVGLIGTALHRQEQAEAGLMALTDELEARVQERSDQLEAAHEKLLRRERLAAIGQLTATVTHELRNPIGTLIASMYLLRDHLGNAGPDAAGILDRMQRSVDRCNHIVTELLDFSRARELTLLPVAVDALIRNTLAELQRPPWLTFTFHGGLGDLRVPLDADHLRRALINLHDNAVQALEARHEREADREARLEVTTAVVDDAVECRVVDNGPGMSEEVREQAFEPLFSTKQAGVGLGLPIVRQAVEQHGGTITLQSTPGEGTTFTIRLPLQPPAAAAPD